MTVPPQGGVRWRKSSSGEDTCVELAHSLDAVRDSKNTSGPVLSVCGLPEFLRQAKAGRFNR